MFAQQVGRSVGQSIIPSRKLRTMVSVFSFRTGAGVFSANRKLYHKDEIPRTRFSNCRLEFRRSNRSKNSNSVTITFCQFSRLILLFEDCLLQVHQTRARLTRGQQSLLEAPRRAEYASKSLRTQTVYFHITLAQSISRYSRNVVFRRVH